MFFDDKIMLRSIDCPYHLIISKNLKFYIKTHGSQWNTNSIWVQICITVQIYNNISKYGHQIEYNCEL